MDTIVGFFSSMDGHHYESMETINGTLRFEVGSEGGVRTYTVNIRSGDVSLTEAETDADCVISTDEQSLSRIFTGAETPITLLIKGSIDLQGDLRLFFLLRQLLPDSVGQHSLGGDHARR